MPDEIGLLSAELWELGVTGIEETATGLRAYFDDATNPETIRRAFPNLELRIKTEVQLARVQEPADRDPVYAGRHFVIVPVAQAESQRALTPHLIVLPVDAAMAFGSGRHETTQLCLEAMETVLKPGDTVLDVGCGSGILALAAGELGATRVIATDIDEAAIFVARRHFHGPLFVGSADSFPAQTADIVLCNITGKIDDRIASDLHRITKSDGHLILSGFTAETIPQNFKADQVLQQGDWQCWICNPDCFSSAVQATDLNTHEIHWWL